MLDMNPEIREQWCKALRSGEYTQGQGSLRDGDRYCCLGVLTDLYVKAGNDETFPSSIRGDTFSIWTTGTLANVVLEWAGLDSDNPALENNARWQAAAEWNDESNATFAMIADMIDGSQS